MTTHESSAINKATQELISKHVNPATPTPFKTEGTLGSLGMVGASADFSPEADTPPITPDASTADEIPE